MNSKRREFKAGHDASAVAKALAHRPFAPMAGHDRERQAEDGPPCRWICILFVLIGARSWFNSVIA